MNRDKLEADLKLLKAARAAAEDLERQGRHAEAEQLRLEALASTAASKVKGR